MLSYILFMNILILGIVITLFLILRSQRDGPVFLIEENRKLKELTETDATFISSLEALCDQRAETIAKQEEFIEGLSERTDVLISERRELSNKLRQALEERTLKTIEIKGMYRFKTLAEPYGYTHSDMVGNQVINTVNGLCDELAKLDTIIEFYILSDITQEVPDESARDSN